MSPARQPKPLRVGRPAPDFTLPQSGGGTLTLSALRPGKVVLFFYPRDSTPTCTTEAQSFSALLPEFTAAGTTVLGISKDSIAAHDRFCRKSGLGVTLLSDENGHTCETYGAWGDKVTFGHAYRGIIRTTVLVDGQGRVAEIWVVTRVAGHAEAVLAAARALP